MPLRRACAVLEITNKDLASLVIMARWMLQNAILLWYDRTVIPISFYMQQTQMVFGYEVASAARKSQQVPHSSCGSCMAQH